MEEPHTEPIEQLARAIAQRGLTTPARIMLDIIAPLGFLASQATLFARPFIPKIAGHTRSMRSAMHAAGACYTIC
jgi:hypothetical protein